ncbi:MAG TPA: hypothetical protein VG777_09470, partial [Thermoanaerobaculia bacterium]|nr:hypothetical protein [Thermoanaerobaculia bacterium]
AIRGALDRAGASAGNVDLVLLSRNGRTALDAMESRIVGRLLPRARRIAVKDAIGEMAAAGGAELVTAAREIAEGSASTALVHSMGAGGNFLAAVLEKP